MKLKGGLENLQPLRKGLIKAIMAADLCLYFSFIVEILAMGLFKCIQHILLKTAHCLCHFQHMPLDQVHTRSQAPTCNLAWVTGPCSPPVLAHMHSASEFRVHRPRQRLHGALAFTLFLEDSPHSPYKNRTRCWHGTKP